MVNAFNNLPRALLALYGKNYDQWYKKVKVLFSFQDVLEIVDFGVKALIVVKIPTLKFRILPLSSPSTTQIHSRIPK